MRLHGCEEGTLAERQERNHGEQTMEQVTVRAHRRQRQAAEQTMQLLAWHAPRQILLDGIDALQISLSMRCKVQQQRDEHLQQLAAQCQSG